MKLVTMWQSKPELCSWTNTFARGETSYSPSFLSDFLLLYKFFHAFIESSVFNSYKMVLDRWRVASPTKKVFPKLVERLVEGKILMIG